MTQQAKKVDDDPNRRLWSGMYRAANGEGDGIRDAIDALDDGADPDCNDPAPVFPLDDDEVLTPLMFSTRIVNPRVEELIYALVLKGADMEAEDNVGWTPAFKAAFRANRSALVSLSQLGADLEHTALDGSSIDEVVDESISGIVQELRDQRASDESEELLEKLAPGLAKKPKVDSGLSGL